MSKQTIAVDIDDVLSASADGFTQYSNVRWGAQLKAEDYTEEWAAFWKVSIEEALRRIKEVEKDAPLFISQYAHFEEAIPVLGGLIGDYKLIAVTSRRKVFKEATDAWLQRHFPNLFEAVHYVGIWDEELKDHENVQQRLNQTKTALCRELGVNYLIDDQPKHCIDAAKAGIQALLFGDYKWNKDVPQQLNLTRVATWRAVKEHFDAKSRR